VRRYGMWKQYLAGVVGSIIIGYFWVHMILSGHIVEPCSPLSETMCVLEISEGGNFPWSMIFYGLPGGIIAGFIGNFLITTFAKTTLDSNLIGVLTIILSIFISHIFFGRIESLVVS
jgi:hypothetical protein